MSDRLKKIFDNDEHDLLKITNRSKAATPEDRLQAAFLEICDFYAEHGREPLADTTDMSERKLGTRLRALKLDDEKIELLKGMDSHGLLALEAPPESIEEVFNNDKFGLLDDPTGILTIKNVPTDLKKPDFIARPHPSKDFAQFEEGFKRAHEQLKNGNLIRVRISSESQILTGRYYVLKGLLTYVAWMAEKFESKAKTNARLRLIYENGTESNILLRSFAREIYRNGQRIVPYNFAELTDWREDDSSDVESGYIYVLKSESKVPQIQDIQNLYKIGFTSGSVEDRIKGAETDPTYLMAPVKVVDKYKCLNMNTQKFEHLIHRFFSDVKLDMKITAIDGTSYTPSEWYVVPQDIIDKVINLMVSGEIVYVIGAETQLGVLSSEILGCHLAGAGRLGTKLGAVKCNGRAIVCIAAFGFLNAVVDSRDTAFQIQCLAGIGRFLGISAVASAQGQGNSDG